MWVLLRIIAALAYIFIVILPSLSFANQDVCGLQTIYQIAEILKPSIKNRYSDAQLIIEGNQLFFQADFRSVNFSQNLHNKQGDTISSFFSSKAGVGGVFSLIDLPPVAQSSADVQNAPPSVSSPMIAPNITVIDDGYFKEMRWTVPSTKFGKTLIVHIFYIRGTSSAFIDELTDISRSFGSCDAIDSYKTIDETYALELARGYVVHDAVAGEIVQHDPKVLDKYIPGRWSSHHEIIFRGGCCCACDGECDDIVIKMKNNGVLVGIKVKHWVCGGRNKSNTIR